MLQLLVPNPLDLIFLVIAGVYAARKMGLKELKASDTGVDIKYFTPWKEAEIKSINVLMWATWKLFVIKECINALAIIFPPPNMAFFMVISAATAVAQFIGLFIAAFYGTRAKKLQKAAGIKVSFFPGTKGENSFDVGLEEAAKNILSCSFCDFSIDINEFKKNELFCPECGSRLEEGYRTLSPASPKPQP